MFIKKLRHNVYDVFLGKGYDNWTRVHRGHFGVNHMAGHRLPRHILKQVAEALR